MEKIGDEDTLNNSNNTLPHEHDFDHEGEFLHINFHFIYFLVIYCLYVNVPLGSIIFLI